MDNRYDVAVLGAGPGGYETAIRCAQYGLKTALIEKDKLGGTCLNRGCIPTKALLHGAELYQQAKEAAKYGVNVGSVTYDYAKIAAHKDKVVSKLVGGVGAMEKANGVDVINGFGKLVDKNTIDVEGKKLPPIRSFWQWVLLLPALRSPELMVKTSSTAMLCFP